MKCEVFDCTYNNDTKCLNMDNVIIHPCEDGFWCGGFKEKLESKLRTVHISKEIISGNESIILRNTGIEVFSYYMDEILKELERLFGYKPEHVYFDTTLRNGFKNSNRFCKVFLDKNGKCIKHEPIHSNTETYKELKLLCCNFIREDSNRLNYPTITSTQRKLIEKGLNI